MDASKTILLTGFDPFGGESVNPSWLAVSRLAGNWDGPAALETVRLPVVFSESAVQLRAAVERVQPDVVISVGEAGGRTQVTPELVGINWDDARIPDNAGEQPRQTPIDPEGPAARFSTLPVYEAVDRMRAAGIPASVSTTAGTYVCNHVLYTVCGIVEATQRKPMLGGFCHVPYAPEQVAGRADPSLSPELAARGLGLLARAALDRLERVEG